MSHVAEIPCPLCDEKLKQAHPYLVEWFSGVKERHPSIHVSWSFRDEASQNEAVASGNSKLKWPNSFHNKVNQRGEPCSWALDLFELSPEGRAIFNPLFYTGLAHECVDLQDEIIWGGRFRSISDLDHFQYNPS